MLIAKCTHCGAVEQVPDDYAGKILECECGYDVLVPQLKKTQKINITPINNNIINNKKEYKVLTQKDKWFSGKFDPAKLEGAINAYAKQGWRFVGCATASIPSLMGGPREEMVVIMERG